MKINLIPMCYQWKIGGWNSKGTIYNTTKIPHIKSTGINIQSICKTCMLKTRNTAERNQSRSK